METEEAKRMRLLRKLVDDLLENALCFAVQGQESGAVFLERAAELSKIVDGADL